MSDLDITDSVLAELRSAADIVEVIGEHTKLKKAGRSWKGLCPFHRERTPSFTVDRDKGLYHCFGCGVGGDVIHFVRQIDRLDFPETVEALAQRFGVTIPRRERGPRDDRRDRLFEALAAAHRFFQAELAKSGNPAQRYLTERGVSAELTARLRLGYAPHSWDSLARALTPAYPESLLIEAGLLQARPEGKGSYDRFRNRLIFVVCDDRGRPVGFGGRALEAEDTPKYLNSPESPVFLKKRLLYGYSDAREAIRRREHAVLVEGYFDHLALIAAGIDETVASMGTALTQEQAEKLKRLAPRVTVCYDGDPAGRAATHGALKHLLAQGFEARVARLPDGEDPHDVLARSGSDRLAAILTEAPDFLTWLLEEFPRAGAGTSSTEKAERINAVAEILKEIPDGVVRHEECRRLATAVGVPLEILWDRIKPRKTPRSGPPAAVSAPGTPGNAGVLSVGEIPAAERRILQILMTQAELKSLIVGTLTAEHLVHSFSRRLFDRLVKAAAESEVVDFQSQIADFTQEDRSLVSEILLKEEPPATPEGVDRLLKQLDERRRDRESKGLQPQIEAAEAAGDKDLLEALMRRKDSLMKEKPGSQGSRKGNELGD